MNGKMAVSGVRIYIRPGRRWTGHGVNPGTPFENLPDNWVCPSCGSSKDMYKKL